MTENLTDKTDQLLDFLRRSGRVAVAFSAGVDSTVLCQAARMACGDDAIAVIAESPSLATGVLEEAEELAKQIGIPLHVVRTEEFARPEYQANAGNRCFYCKDTLYTAVEQLHADLKFDVIVNGANTDDLGDYRPGMQAAANHQVLSPFVECGIGKAEIRQLAKSWDLPVWDKPASPCLSSRIAHGLEVTRERVARVDAAERYLKETFGLRELRVRLEFHELARIEVPLSELAKFVESAEREQLVEHFRELGFRYVTLDLAGFRSGSMNDVLQLEIRV
ncbi:ATP-dependent sacrificial sulfur transferase LarE [Rubinisphaera sp. JC750]|uniref:ATP-dependent sacrificial sulfur transferase LarE n=1 Tax=Rubinisphaera sp. JC750 TaxID=2898658 RepID=UPI001F01E331|nr:ATP-dependent sacrificial sulfur transferase LarE [Rubinisphaera sp. JC750]